MNREQRRSLYKKLKNVHISKDVIEKLSDLYDADLDISEGDTVKINYERIMSQPDYPHMISEYKKFIDANKDVEFTAELDETTTFKNTFCLKEDVSDPKWLFWCDDLIKTGDK